MLVRRWLTTIAWLNTTVDKYTIRAATGSSARAYATVSNPWRMATSSVPLKLLDASMTKRTGSRRTLVPSRMRHHTLTFSLRHAARPPPLGGGHDPDGL